MLYLHIETSQEQLGHAFMITDQQRLIQMIKRTHSRGRWLTCDRKKIDQKEGINSTYANR